MVPLVRVNRISVPVNVPVVTREENSLKIFFKGYYSYEGKSYLVRDINHRTITLQENQSNDKLLNLLKLISFITLLAPLIGLYFLLTNYLERNSFHYTIRPQAPEAFVRHEAPEVELPVQRLRERLDSPRLIEFQKKDWTTLAKEAIAKSLAAPVPLAPRFILTNIFNAFSEYAQEKINARSLASEISKLDSLKEEILEELFNQLKITDSVRGLEIKKTLREEYETGKRELQAGVRPRILENFIQEIKNSSDLPTLMNEIRASLSFQEADRVRDEIFDWLASKDWTPDTISAWRPCFNESYSDKFNLLLARAVAQGQAQLDEHGQSWLEKLFYAILKMDSLLPKDLEVYQQLKIFTDLRSAVEGIALHCDGHEFFLPDLTAIKKQYDPLAGKLGLDPMVINIDTDRDKDMAEELQKGS